MNTFLAIMVTGGTIVLHEYKTKPEGKTFLLESYGEFSTENKAIAKFDSLVAEFNTL